MPKSKRYLCRCYRCCRCRCSLFKMEQKNSRENKIAWIHLYLHAHPLTPSTLVYTHLNRPSDKNTSKLKNAHFNTWLLKIRELEWTENVWKSGRMKFVWLLLLPKTKVYSSSTSTTKHTSLDLATYDFRPNGGAECRLLSEIANFRFPQWNQVDLTELRVYLYHNCERIIDYLCWMPGCLFIIPLRRPYTLQLLLLFDREIDSRHMKFIRK